MGFFEEVYGVLKTIPKGKVTTYGAIAFRLGRPRNARAVGYALHANPRPGEIPCHRVVNREGKLSTGFAFGGIDIQKSMLEQEGIKVNSDYTVDLSKYGV